MFSPFFLLFILVVILALSIYLAPSTNQNKIFLNALQMYLDYTFNPEIGEGKSKLLAICNERINYFNNKENKFSIIKRSEEKGAGPDFYTGLKKFLETNYLEALENFKEAYDLEKFKDQKSIKITNGQAWLIKILISDMYQLTDQKRLSFPTILGAYCNFAQYINFNIKTDDINDPKWLRIRNQNLPIFQNRLNNYAKSLIEELENNPDLKNDAKEMVFLYEVLARNGDPFIFNNETIVYPEYLNKARNLADKIIEKYYIENYPENYQEQSLETKDSFELATAVFFDEPYSYCGVTITSKDICIDYRYIEI